VFLNIVLDEAVEEKAGGEKVRIGMVVCIVFGGFQSQ
jgi:small nuclear ribonucleoprotein G